MLLRYWVALLTFYLFILLLGSFMFNMIECSEGRDAGNVNEEVEEKHYISKLVSDLRNNLEKLPLDLASNLSAYLIRMDHRQETEERYWDLKNSVIKVMSILLMLGSG